jgi:hypothetical protein
VDKISLPKAFAWLRGEERARCEEYFRGIASINDVDSVGIDISGVH